jgi:hypothetical protein
MNQVKDTERASVRIGYDGKVHKVFRGHLARERFDNEVRILQLLEARGCSFVPRLLESFPDELKIITSNCGARVDHLNEDRMKELFAELEASTTSSFATSPTATATADSASSTSNSPPLSTTRPLPIQPHELARPSPAGRRMVRPHRPRPHPP